MNWETNHCYLSSNRNERKINNTFIQGKWETNHVKQEKICFAFININHILHLLNISNVSKYFSACLIFDIDANNLQFLRKIKIYWMMLLEIDYCCTFEMAWSGVGCSGMVKVVTSIIGCSLRVGVWCKWWRREIGICN